jgi:hypothetical protein
MFANVSRCLHRMYGCSATAVFQIVKDSSRSASAFRMKKESLFFSWSVLYSSKSTTRSGLNSFDFTKASSKAIAFWRCAIASELVSKIYSDILGPCD